MKTKFRIVTDRYAGFEVQKKNWYSFFWFQVDYVNTHETLQDALDFLRETKSKMRFRKKVVYRETLG